VFVYLLMFSACSIYNLNGEINVPNSLIVMRGSNIVCDFNKQSTYNVAYKQIEYKNIRLDIMQQLSHNN